MKKLFVSASLLGALLLSGGNLLSNGDASKGTEKWSENQVLLMEEENSFFQTVSPTALCEEIIEVDPRAKYIISGKFKAAGAKTAKVFLALRLLDKDKKVIPSTAVTTVPKSDMVLAAACSPQDTVLKVKDASAVQLNKAYIAYAAFQTKADLSDLPNRNLSKGQVTNIVKKGDIWEINLKKPCGLAYPAGTAIRLQRLSAPYMYPIKRKELKNDGKWYSLSGRTYGSVKSGASSAYFWPGTKYLQIVIIAGEHGMVCFDDIVFKKITK